MNKMVRIAPKNGENNCEEMIEDNLHRDDETVLSEEETFLSEYLNMKGIIWHIDMSLGIIGGMTSW